MQGKESNRRPVAWTPPTGIPDVRSRKVIVAAFGDPNPQTLKTLAQSLPKGSTLTVVSEDKVLIPNGKFKGRWIKGHPESAATLLKAGVAEADSVLVVGFDDWTDTEADIQVCSVRMLVGI
jgi:voltage-gated potassium channel Kch